MFKLGAFSLNAFSFDLQYLSNADFDNLETLVKAERSKRSVSQELSVTEQCLVRCGQHILAIKAYRERTSVGLKEAKDACDAFRRTIVGWFEGAGYDETTGRWGTSRW